MTAEQVEMLKRRLEALDRHIAAAQADQAALWAAIRSARGEQRVVGGRLREIIGIVASRFGVAPADILSDRRHAEIAAARHAACWLARQLTPLSYPAIARRLGRDHTTVMHSVRAAELRIGRDSRFAERLAGLEAELAGRFRAHQQLQCEEG